MREGNYYCIELDCVYTTNLINSSEEELTKKLEDDGGFDINKTTKCPMCYRDSLVYIK